MFSVYPINSPHRDLYSPPPLTHIHHMPHITTHITQDSQAGWPHNTLDLITSLCFIIIDSIKSKVKQCTTKLLMSHDLSLGQIGITPRLSSSMGGWVGKSFRQLLAQRQKRIPTSTSALYILHSAGLTSTPGPM